MTESVPSRSPAPPSALALPHPPTGRRTRLLALPRRIYRLLQNVLALIALVQILMILTPLSDGLYRWLDVTVKPSPADVLVCLGGNEGRLVWTIDAYRRGLGPRVVVSNMPGAAQWMRDKLVQLGLPGDRILVDESSAVTADHPAGVRRLPGISPATTRILLITDPEHSRRALACFRKAGYQHVEVMRAGFAPRWDNSYLMRCRWRIMSIPKIWYETAGLIQYRLLGHI